MNERSFHIQSYCRIRNRSISLNGHPLLVMDGSETLNGFLRSAYTQLAIDYPKFHKMDGLCKAVFIAVELMARESGPFDTDTALVFANRSSSYLSDSKHATAIADAVNPVASPATFVYTLPNIAMGEISIRHQLHSENVFFIFGSYSPEFLAPYTNTLMEGKRAGDVISGWTEVTEQSCDVLLCHIGRPDSDKPHTVEQLKILYNE